MADYPADSFYASDPEEVRCYEKCLHYVPNTAIDNLVKAASGVEFSPCSKKSVWQP